MRTLARLRPHDQILQVVVLPGVAERLAGKGELEDIQALLHPRHALAGGEAERGELLRPVPEGDRDLQASLRHVVEDGNLLGKRRGMVQRQDVAVGADADVFRPLNQGGHEDGGRGTVAVGSEEMLLHEHIVEAKPRGFAHQEQSILPHLLPWPAVMSS